MSLSGQDEYYVLRENIEPAWGLLWWPAKNDNLRYWSAKDSDWAPLPYRAVQHLSPLNKIDAEEARSLTGGLPQLTRPRLRKWIRFCEQVAEAHDLATKYPGDRAGWRDGGYWHGYVLWRDQQAGDADLSEQAYNRHLEDQHDKYLG
ncbi:hypothetical protein [Nocardioides sp. P5_C9_2]